MKERRHLERRGASARPRGGAGDSASGSRPRALEAPARARARRRSHCRMISSNACLCSRSRRLSSSEMWRFQRGKSAARRPDAMSCAAPALQRRRSAQGLVAAARSMRRPACAGRPAAPEFTSRTRRRRCHPGPSSGSCRKWLGAEPESQPPHPTTCAARKHAAGADAGRRLMTPLRGRKRRGRDPAAGRRPGHAGGSVLGGKDAGKGLLPPACLPLLPYAVLYFLSWLATFFFSVYKQKWSVSPHSSSVTVDE